MKNSILPPSIKASDYGGRVKNRNDIEAITTILYPDDSTAAGKELRLKQEYFFSAAGVASILKKL